MSMLGDVAEVSPAYQPGHTHCDMLSFEVCWDGRPVIVDTGTSTYEVGRTREFERGTAAHNVVQVGDLEQSEVWGSFRVARRARVESMRVGRNSVTARIRAFPPTWVGVERSWTFDGERVTVEDVLPSTDELVQAPCTARLHFHPDARPARSGSEWTAGGLRISFDGADAVRAVAYDYAPEFNRRVNAQCLEVDFRRTLITRLGP